MGGRDLKSVTKIEAASELNFEIKMDFGSLLNNLSMLGFGDISPLFPLQLRLAVKITQQGRFKLDGREQD